MRDKCVEISENTNKMRDRLIEMLQKRSCFYNKNKCNARCSNCDYVIIDNNDINKLADHFLANGGIVLPCKVGDIVYCIVAKGGICGGLIYTRHIVKRKVDKLIYDGSRWEMMSKGVYPDCKNGNEVLYAYFDDLVFVSEEKAGARLAEILGVGKGKEEAERALKGGE